MTTTKYVLRNSKTGEFVQSIYGQCTNEEKDCKGKLIEFKDVETAKVFAKWLGEREETFYTVIKLEYTETEVLD